MSSTIWVIIGLIFVIVWLWIGWEIWNSPLMPDDYDMDDIEKEIWKDLNHK